jgi:hypothetical protein
MLGFCAGMLGELTAEGGAERGADMASRCARCRNGRARGSIRLRLRL